MKEELKQHNRVIKILILGLLISIFTNEAQIAKAQEISATIEPSIIRIDAKAPSLIKTPISITNNSNENAIYSIFLLPFKESDSKNGEPNYDKSLIKDYSDLFNRVQISDESSSLTQVSLAPKQKKDLTMSILINNDEKPRDYYFSVVFLSETSSKEKNSTTGNRAGIGSNILLSIGPKSEINGFIENFSIKKFLTKGPVNISLQVKNNSSYYITPKGNILIKNIFGQTVGNLTIREDNILAKSSRILSSDNNYSSPNIIWNEEFLFGIYKAELNLALSDNGPLLKETKTFVALPLEPVIGLTIILIIIVGITKRARSKTL